MTSGIHLTFAPSQYPWNVREDLIESFRSRKINHKFHYDSVKQTHKWLALHEAYSPSRLDPDCIATYDQAFVVALHKVLGSKIHVVGLGCGGGQKDARLLALLRDAAREVSYSPVDVSAAMVMVAYRAASNHLTPDHIHPLVCDLARAEDLEPFLRIPQQSAAVRLLTFFGMIPNFEPDALLPKLAGWIQPGDFLLLSANLAPGSNYAAGVRKVLPLYDNPLTRDWLFTLLRDLGVEPDDGHMRFEIAEAPAGSTWLRIEAHFQFAISRTLLVEGERIEFAPGESLRLFFSYRFTPQNLSQLLGSYGLSILDQWIASSGEEGVFLLTRPMQ